jgi:hypothetical protein
MKQILSLRLSRRAIGAAVLDATGLRLADGRHLRSNTRQAIDAAIRFVEQFANDATVTAIALDRPLLGSSAVGEALAEHVSTLAEGRGLALLPLDKSAILAAYGVTPIQSRTQLRPLVAKYWPELSHLRRRPAPHVLDAVAAGLYAECQLALNPPKT